MKPPDTKLAVFWVASLALLLLTSCSSDEWAPQRPAAGGAGSGVAAETAASPQPGDDWRWVGIRDVEVLAPASWEFDYEAVRPDCIVGGGPRDPWARGVPISPYVTVGTPSRAVPAIGCNRENRPGDPDPAFGELPPKLWQPFVKLEQARPDLEDPARADGSWEHRGWTLTRQSVGDVQITVLAPPDQPTLGAAVLGSARRVETTSLGCEVDSPVAAKRFARPEGAPIPAPDEVKTIAVCHYSRSPGRGGLEGSRQITGKAARDLVRAIHDAPAGGGPDRPRNCLPSMYGDSAIALRFLGDADATAPVAEAYVYFDWCFGNGVFDSAGARSLTEASCAPLFARAPVTFWSGQTVVAEVCGMGRG